VPPGVAWRPPWVNLARLLAAHSSWKALEFMYCVLFAKVVEMKVKTDGF
jgi:hypothetical protein